MVANCRALTNTADYKNLWTAIWVAKNSKIKVQQSQYLARAVLCFQNATVLLWHHMMGGARAHLRC